MYFSTVALFALAQLVPVRAQTYGFDTLTSPPKDSTFAVGSILPIVWEPEATTGTVSIILNGGATPGTLLFVTTIATSIKSQAGSYNWTIPADVGSFATYGLNLTHDNAPEFQYSSPFHLTGGSGTSSSSSSSSASGTSSVSSTSSSTSASGSATVSTTSSGAGTTSVVQSTPSATFSSTTSAVMTSSTGFSNSTVSKTSSPQSSSTSSTPASTISSTKTNGASATFVSGSLAVVAAMVFAVAL